MTEFRFLNGDGATRYIAPTAVRHWAANGRAADAAPGLIPQEPTGKTVGNAENQDQSADASRQQANPDLQQQIRVQIAELSQQHRELDEQVNSVAGIGQGKPDELLLRRLKKKKLMLKDRIAALQMQLVPDIPA